MAVSSVPRLTELLSPDDMARIASLAARRKYRDGEIIHERGDPEDNMGVLIAGQIKLTNPRSDGAEVFSGLIHTGQNYGDAGLLHGETRLHRAVAMGETVIDHLTREQTDELLKTPAILQAFYLIATFRLSVTLSMLDDMRTLRPDIRLARLISRMQQAIGQERLQFLQEEFAGMLGISTVTLAKALRQLKEHGVVQSGYRHIGVTDPERLRQWLSDQES